MFRAFVKDIPFGISLLLIAIALGFVAFIVPIGGNKSLIVRSGSMEPVIGVGDLISVAPAQNYEVGDIVAFKDAAKGQTVTHRIVGVEDGGFYQTKGDANEEADFTLVPKENVIGKADVGIRGIGKLLAVAKTQNGFLAFAIFPALLVVIFEAASILKEIRKGKRSFDFAGDLRQVQILKHLYHHYGKPMGLSALLPILATLLIVGSTWAFSEDSETSTGNIFAAAESFTQTGNIIVTKYSDINNIGQKDDGEPVLEGWDINLSASTLTTGQNGQATFVNVEPNQQLTLSENLQGNWLQTNISCDTAGVYDSANDFFQFSLAPGQTVNCFIGNQQESAE